MKSKLSKKLDPQLRLVIAVGLALLVSALLPPWIRLPTRILFAWNSGAYFFLSLTWRKMLKANSDKTRRHARCDYEGRLAIFMLIITSACASILAIAFLLTYHKQGLLLIPISLRVLLTVMTILGAWLLVHTMFALQYARIYYQHHTDSNSEQLTCTGGLYFPNEDCPDYLDFLYYSFVIGMTGQVSDVQATSRWMRRLSLIHGVFSFFFNTAILAMTINIIAALI